MERVFGDDKLLRYCVYVCVCGGVLGMVWGLGIGDLRMRRLRKARLGEVNPMVSLVLHVVGEGLIVVISVKVICWTR